MEELFPGIYRETVQLQGAEVNPMNLYLVKGRAGERSLLVDTGFGVEPCMEAVERLLGAAEISCQELDVFITHNHPDHSGLAGRLSALGARIYMNPEESIDRYDLLHCYLNTSACQEEQLRLIGVTREATPDVFRFFCQEQLSREDKYCELIEFPFIPVREGDVFLCGGYLFRALLLRGHTYGQMGLVEEEHRLLFCADQLMREIVPNIGTTWRDISLIKGYLSTMEQFKHTYREYTLLPGHYGVITDVRREANRIIFSYLDKCGLMKNILEQSREPLTVYQVGVLAYGRGRPLFGAASMTTVALILAKTFSCLEYLCEEGFAARKEQDGTLFWTAAGETAGRSGRSNI